MVFINPVTDQAPVIVELNTEAAISVFVIPVSCVVELVPLYHLQF